MNKDNIKFFGIFIIVFVGWLIYSNSFHSPFHFDDHVFIAKNQYIRSMGIFFDSFFSKIQYTKRFVSFFSFAINYHFHKLEFFGYHVVNFSLHIINALLVAWLTRLLLLHFSDKASRLHENRHFIAFFVSLLFLTHPIQTQAVTYICQRFTLLASFFYLLSSCLFLKSKFVSGKIKRFLWMLLLCSGFLGLFSKETVITLPIMLFTLEGFFCKFSNGGNRAKFFKRGLLMVVALALAGFFVFILLGFDKNLLFDPARKVGISQKTYLLTQFKVIWTYIRLLILPIGQHLDYDYPLSKSFFDIQTLLSFLGLITVLGAAFVIKKIKPILAIGIFWFFISLSLESSIFPLQDLLFEHRLYLPSFGFFLLVVVGLFYLVRNIKVMSYILIPIVCVCSLLTYRRNIVWQDSFKLVDESVRISPGKARCYVHRGIFYAIQRKFDLAFEDFNAAIRLNSKDSTAYLDRGLLYLMQAKEELALSDFNKSLELNSQNFVAYNARGNFLRSKKVWDRALNDFAFALLIEPGYDEAYYNRGLLYQEIQEYAMALNDYNKAIELKPYYEYYYQRGVLFLELGKPRVAKKDFEQAIALNPQFLPAFYKLEMVK